MQNNVDSNNSSAHVGTVESQASIEVKGLGKGTDGGAQVGSGENNSGNGSSSSSRGMMV